MSSRSRLLAVLGAAACLVAGVIATPAEAARPAWITLATSGPTNLPPVQNEVQRVAVDAEGGTFTLKFGANETAPLSWNIEPSGGVGPTASLQNALEALPNVGAGNVSVTGGVGSKGADIPYAVAFKGTLTGTNVAELSANAALLTGGDNHAVTIFTTVPGGPGTTTIALFAQNVGGFGSSGPITLHAVLPAGVTTEKAPTGTGWTCPGGAGMTEFTCTSSTVVEPGVAATSVKAAVVAGPTATSGTVQMSVSGGGAKNLSTYSMPLTVSATQADAGIQSFVAGAYDSNGELDTRAGGHPYSGSAAIMVNTRRTASGDVRPVGDPKDISVDLPPGFLGNPTAASECDEAVTCKPESIVALVQIPLLEFGLSGEVEGVYNIKHPFGYPSKFQFYPGAGFETINVVGGLHSDGDYGLEVSSLNTPQILTVFGSFFTFWGAPNDPSHDAQRCTSGFVKSCEKGGKDNVAFLTNPTDCAGEAAVPPKTTLRFTTWPFPDLVNSGTVTLPPVTECDKLKFNANFTFEPSETKSDSTASFRTQLTVPSEGLTNATKLTTPEIKDTAVLLPKGVVLNASGADGLGSCSEEQIGLLGTGFAAPNPIRFNKAPNQCPDSSKIGTGELTTALLHDPLKGNLYLAAQGDGNPFGSLFAIYLVIEDPSVGIFIKLPGEVEADKETGQLTVNFRNLPQLPFTTLTLDLKGGNRSALASPTTCGNFVTTATNTPWSAPESGPPTESANGFDINQGPNGLPCANTPQERPFDIGWSAGAQSTSAGASGPFIFNITRPDGSQELNTLELGTPAGLAASLKGVPYCSEAQIAAAAASTGKQEQANPACPAASQVGSAVTGSGSGPTPFYAGGKLYLAGPYKGAPISVVAVTPAVAGPFDLGNVVVRSAVFINRSTAQVTAKTDPIPQILKGVVLRIRDVRITLDRKDWTINPTSCDPSAVNLTATGNSGAVASKTTRFQVGNCQSLAFGPKLKAHLSGGTKRGDHPAFTAEVNFPAGQANTKDVQVTIPHSEFLEQAHINTICTRGQAAANACPSGAIYGYAEAETPLLDGKLVGPVFLKANPNHKLPDLAIALRGPDNQPVEVEFAGRIDSVKGQIRNTIEGLPDVPVSKFVLRMKGGRKGLLANSRDLCAAKVTRMTVSMVGHNNKTTQFRPPLNRSCKGKGKKVKRAQKRHQRQAGLMRFAAIW